MGDEGKSEKPLRLEDLGLGEILPPAPAKPRAVDAFATQLTRKQTPGAKNGPGFIRRGNAEDYEPSLANAKIAITSLGVRPKYDVFHDRIEFEGYGKPSGEPFSDTALKMRNAVVERFGFDPRQGFIEDATRVLALENSFDPVREYLDGLTWDGTPRLNTWLSVYLGAEDDELTRAIGRAVLIAGVRRVRRPGCKFDAMLVLEGDQGLGKSAVVKVLAGGDDNFTDALDFRQSYKEHMEILGGKWIVEAPEMSGLSQAAVQYAKQFISKTHDRGRKAYGKSTEEVPRRCILIGTTNDATYLKDPTGNRRFWPVRAGKIDLPALRKVRDLLWAEAAAAEPGEADPVTIPAHLWAVAAERAKARVEADPWEDTLAALLPRFAKVAEGKQRITTQAIFGQILMKDMREVAMRENKRVAACMRRLGWDGPKPLWIGRTAVKGYEKDN
ncbi:VapE domain-containing protein [Brucella cytisi]|uniref:virulence-associated E family protein n=1 Tax=Brucella TaxID=234 RepID=UPI00221E91D6|nr:virulence-associated E family protein [Brucella sp. MAB-22]UYT54536.1 virulence-associated E family protein [Brucella sp. MAB-22]